MITRRRGNGADWSIQGGNRSTGHYDHNWSAGPTGRAGQADLSTDIVVAYAAIGLKW